MGLQLDGQNINAVTIDGEALSSFTVNGEVLLAPPTIITQPAGTTIKDNQTYTLSVAARSLGGDYTYQWYRNGVAIAGATGSSYVHPAMAAATYQYHVVVGNKMGSITSAKVSVVVQVSWAATHVLTVGYNAFFGIYSYGWGGSYGNIQPRSFAGAGIAILGASSNPANLVQLQLSGTAYAGRRVRVEFDSPSRGFTATFTAPYGNAVASVTNSSLASYIRSKNGRNINVKIYFI